MSDPFDTLPSLLDHIWSQLEGGAAHAVHPFRQVTLATTGTDGPEARIVTLRAADPREGTLEVHSDMRTGKVRALANDARATFLFWDPQAQLQLRALADVTVVSAAADRWKAVPASAQGNYGTEPAPGTPLSACDEYKRRPDIEKFAVLVGRVRHFDVVSLNHAPHRRALYDLLRRSATWVAP